MAQSKLAPFLEMTVLLAEDDPVMRESLARTLGLYFREVLAAENGNRALALWETRTVHMAVLDIAMPGLSGLEIAAQIRERDPDLPVIILTCHTDVSYMQTAVRLRLMDYVLKPVDLPGLEKVLDRCLDEMRQRDRLKLRLKGGALFNPSTGVATYRDRNFQLTKNENRFLNYMLKRRGLMVAPYQICQALGSEEEISLNALRNLVYRLRAKIGPDAVVCCKDIGYTLP
jgi:DNA-binding response OmpR family regulator